MATTAMGPLLRQLRKILDPAGSPSVSDAELLERFAAQRDEAAFELLVWRHQRMVWNVCRRTLGNAADAEDAFQATFLALVRKADSLRHVRAVAGWLHTVAYHLALRARKKSAQRTTRSLEGADSAGGPDTADNVMRGDLALALDEEISRLPEKYRLAVVLCYLEGKTYPEAGRQLGLPLGTLSSHLRQARVLLRTRLLRRGIGVSTGLLAVVLGEQAVSASSLLVNATVKAAAALVLGDTAAISTSALTLSEGALPTLAVGKVKRATVVLLAGLLLLGAGWLIPAAALVHPVVPAVPSEREPAPHAERDDEPLPHGALFRFGSVRLRHADGIRASALSADGKRLATASFRAVIVWDLPTGKALWRFACKGEGQFATPGIAFSPDGKYLGYVHNAEQAYVWDAPTGKEAVLLPGHHRHQWAICQFTPDSKQFIFDDQNRLVLWDLAANKETRSLANERCNLLSPDAKIWVAADEQKAITFGDVQTGKRTFQLDVVAARNGIENGVAFSPDSKLLAVIHQNKEIQIRDFPGRGLGAVIALPDSVKRSVISREGYRLAFSADGRMLLVGDKEGFVHRWDLTDLVTGKAQRVKELLTLSRHHRGVAGMHPLPDGKTIITTGNDGLIRRWDAQTGRERPEPDGYVGLIHAVYSSDGRYVAVGDANGRVDLWDARTGRLLRTLERKGAEVAKLAFTPDGQALAACRADNTIHFWAVPSGDHPRVLRFDDEKGLFKTQALTFSSDGRYLLIGGCNRPRLYDLRADKDCWRGDFYFDTSTFSRDGQTLLVTSGPFLIFLDAANGRTRSKVRLQVDTPDNLGVVAALVLSPDGRHVALGLHTGEVLLCDAQSGRTIRRFRAANSLKRGFIFPNRLTTIEMSTVWGVAFAPDGRWLGTAGNDGSVRLWEIATGKEVLRFAAHEGTASGIAFGADGRTFLSCGTDGLAYLWSLRPAADGKPTLDSLWTALADEPAKAYQAIWMLSETRDAPAFLRGKLTPARPVADKQLQKWIDELDSETFTVREAAMKALAKQGDIAEPALRAALGKKPSLEQRQRLENLLKRLAANPPSPDELRMERAIEVLERQNTKEARELLQALAAGAPGARLTRAAQAALHPSRDR